ncbi:hypothetical protein [Paenibacillus sp. HB172176]|uniref:DUF6973 domain-containing protein n=1 Tax=Paenibacillus sp. HB172176 TaxID=2493690 RepID=UPI0014394AE5|nr:hypothetical protein [Paenibacillus sp. HB172176]
MKKNVLIATLSVSAMLFSSTGTMYAASESTQMTASTQVTHHPNQKALEQISMAVHLKMVEEVKQGLITTDEQAWTRIAELDALDLPGNIQPLAAYVGSYLTSAGEMSAAILAVGPIDAYTAKADADTAFAKAATSGYSRPEDGKQDAFRHAYWNILMTRDIGSGQAKEVADIHEEYNPGSALANEMDLYNNSIGRGAYSAVLPGADDSDNALVTEIKSWLDNGFLKYINTSGSLVWTDE